MFKDLKRTAKTQRRKAGFDRNVRMAIFGHGNADDMDLRYDEIDESDLTNAVEQLELFFRNVDQTVDQIEKNAG